MVTDRRRASLLAGLVLLAAFGLTRVLFIARFPYFFDEGTYAGFIHQAAGSTSHLFVSMTIGREPLQIWLGIPWAKLGFSPLIAGRIVSMISGGLTVAVLWRLGCLLGGVLVGWVAAALAVVLPFFLVHDGIGIYEPLVTLVVAAALMLQIELARRPSLRLGVALGIVLGAGILTQRNTEPALVLIPFSLLCFDWSAADRRARLKRWGGAVAFAVLGAVLASVMLRSSSYWHDYQAFNGTDARGVGFAGVRPLNRVLTDPFAFSGKAWAAFRPALVGYLTIPLMLAALGGAILARRAQPRMTGLLLIWIAVPFGVALTFSTLPFPRHVMFIMPAIVVLVAYGFVAAGRWVGRRLPSRQAAAVLAAGAIVLLGPALLLDAKVLAHPASTRYPGPDDKQYVTGTQAGAGWDAIAKIIRQRSTGNPVVVLTANSYGDVIRWLNRPYDRFVYVPLGSPLTSHAQFAIVDDLRFFLNGRAAALATVRQLHLKPLLRFPRPRGGAVLTLYGRGNG